jgi:hypothetical protein
MNVYFRLRLDEFERKLTPTLDHLYQVCYYCCCGCFTFQFMKYFVSPAQYTQRQSMIKRGIPTFGLFSPEFEQFTNHLLDAFLNETFGTILGVQPTLFF